MLFGWIADRSTQPVLRMSQQLTSAQSVEPQGASYMPSEKPDAVPANIFSSGLCRGRRRRAVTFSGISLMTVFVIFGPGQDE
jgi:hypothetical protein